MLEDPPTPTMRDFSARSPSHERRGRGHGAGPERQGLARRRPRRRQARLRRLLQLRAVLEHARDALSAELADGAAAPRHVLAVYCHSGAVYDAHPGWRR